MAAALDIIAVILYTGTQKSVGFHSEKSFYEYYFRFGQSDLPQLTINDFLRFFQKFAKNTFLGLGPHSSNRR
jgi:hypothetical protein